MTRKTLLSIARWILIGVFLLILVATLLRLADLAAYFTVKQWLWAKLGLSDNAATFGAIVLTILLLAVQGTILAYLFLGARQLQAVIISFVAALGLFLANYLVGKEVFFDQEKGEPLKYYCISKARQVLISDAPGYDAVAGCKRMPLTPEAKAAIDRGLAGRYPKPLTQLRFEDIRFFDSITGEPRVWYQRLPDGKYELFDDEGFHPTTGEQLKAVQPQDVEAIRVQHKTVQKSEEERLAKLDALKHNTARETQFEHEVRTERPPTQSSRGERPHVKRMVTQDNFVFVIEACRRSGEQLSCDGSIQNTYKATRFLSVSARAIDNKGSEYRIGRLQIGLMWGEILQYVPMEPGISTRVAVVAQGGTGTASKVNLVLEYNTTNRRGYGDPSAPDAEAMVRLGKAYLRDIDVAQ